MTVGCGGGVSGPDLAQRLTQLAFAADMINLEFAKVAAAFAETDEYDEQGFDSPIAWIKANCHLSGGAASDRVCVGEQLERLGESRAALGMGEIGFAHFALIAKTKAAVGDRLDEARLLRQARKRSVASFRNACMHARHAADADGFVDEEKQGVEARSLTMSTADDGTVLLNCILDKVGGAAVRTALEPLARRAGKDDDRLRDRRLADAFVDLAMHALD
ncbi:MAG TPA: hypothetical protein VGA41_10550, partial [Candidatus Dormibacteraeota bacterium]